VGNRQSSPVADAEASPNPNEAAIRAALSSSTLIADPFPAYALLREDPPVWRGPTGYVEDLYNLRGLATLPIAWANAR